MRAAHLRARGPILVDRSPQALPVPLGGMQPVRLHRRRPALRRWLRIRGPHLLTAAGIGGALTGAVLTLVAGPVAVYVNAGQVHVGSAVLHLVATTADRVIYDGDAAYVLTERGDGGARAAAYWTAGGLLNTGACSLRREADRLVEDCSFMVNGKSFTALDTLDFATGGIWRRTYQDGRQVSIAVPSSGAVVPLAFPVGR